MRRDIDLFGFEVTVCPKFANEVGTKRLDTQLKLRAVGGASIEQQGEGNVPF